MQLKKRFGQHFLHDATIINAIVRSFAPGTDEHIIEIGPGAGAITGPLIAAGARITAVEFDRDMVALLKRKFSDINRLQVIQADILKTEVSALSNGVPIRIIGNLPYNISTPILFHLLKQLPAIHSMYFMLQKEVVDRVAASPGGKDYGRPSVIIQRLCETEADIVIHPDAFKPPPRVMSAMLRLHPREVPVGGELDAVAFERVVARAFSQRRKTLRNTLKKMAGPELIERAGIEPSQRAETVSVAAFARLTREIILNPQ